MGSKAITAVAFINSEGPDLHDGIGGPSHFDPAVMQFVKFQPYKQLAEALKLYITQKLTSEIEGDDTSSSWDRLSEKICQTECGYSDTLDGFWRKIWYNIGETEDICNAWVALIPDEYGLAVVKTGLAVVFQAPAGKSLAKREKIFDTFKGLRDALVRASPDERSFRDKRKVSDCADELYQAVVNSIEDMILVTSKDKTSSCKQIKSPEQFAVGVRIHEAGQKCHIPQPQAYSFKTSAGDIAYVLEGTRLLRSLSSQLYPVLISMLKS